MAARKRTPARRARDRRLDPAISGPPPRPSGDRTSSIRNLSLRVAGRTFPIGDNIEGDTPYELTMEGAGTVTLPVRSPDHSILDVLTSEALLQSEGVRCTIDGVVYVVATVSHDGAGLYTLTLEDEVKWRLSQFTRPISSSRAKTTRFGFLKRLVDEASRRPYPPLPSFIPQMLDKQPIRKAAK